MDELKKLFAVLVYYRHNIHILHWKVTGHGFDCVHELMDKYVDKFNGFIDDIGELILALGGNPLSLQECIETLVDDKDINYLTLNPKDNYSTDKVYEAIDVMFNTLMDLYKDVDVDDDCESKLDEHKYWLRIESEYKNKQRKTK